MVFMYIRCWGSRGSIPVSGAQFNRYGGDTTCMEIRSQKGDIIVIDAGSGIRALGEKLRKKKVKKLDMLFTHAHFDHIMGFPFFSIIYQKSMDITVHGCPFSLPSYKNVLKGIITAPYLPVEVKDIPATLRFAKITTRPFSIGSIHITPIYLSHPNGGLGFRFEENGRSFVFLTDNELDHVHPLGLEYEAYVDFCRDADLLIHDAEYTTRDYKKSWGHSLLPSAVKLGLEAGVKQLGLFHINQRRTDDQVDAMVKQACSIIARKKSPLHCFAVSNSFEITL
jgi:phosphoribosyl 1,2-cyclic phosphodiesterase